MDDKIEICNFLMIRVRFSPQPNLSIIEWYDVNKTRIPTVLTTLQALLFVKFNLLTEQSHGLAII